MHAALERRPAWGPAADGYLLEGSLSARRALAARADRQPGDARSRSRRPTARSTCACGRCNGAQMSLPSNEIRVYVNAPLRPSPPANFQGGRQGLDDVAGVEEHVRRRGAERLASTSPAAWRRHTAVALRRGVLGGAMPDGTFTLRLRALNAAGASNQSGSVTVTSPSRTCASAAGADRTTSRPASATPWRCRGTRRRAARRPPATRSGVAARTTASFPIAARGFALAAPPGTYNFSVRAVNACGAVRPRRSRPS